MFDPRARIFVAGHRGLVGSAIVRRLEAEGADDLVLRTHAELDLADAAAVDAFFASEQPQYVFLAAAKVGGILANASAPADFIHANLALQTHTIHSAWKHGVRKLLFLGSSCIYPRDCPQPIREQYLLSGPLEPSNEAYAVAKIAGIVQCQSYRRQHGFDAICAMPTNLYGPGDNYDLRTSHVLPALLRKMHEAKLRGDATVTLWGSGTPRREFLHVDDLADAVVHLMRQWSDERIVNIGTGEDLPIRALAETIARIVGFEGGIVTDPSKPDGTPRKLLDVSRLSGSGWRARISLEDGIAATYQAFLRDGAGGAAAVS
ncbi:MAG: GDP-L-fucose synthase family protein [Arenimonas sp.]